MTDVALIDAGGASLGSVRYALGGWAWKRGWYAMQPGCRARSG